MAPLFLLGINAILGGLVIQRGGLDQLGYVAAGVAALAVLMVPLVARLKPSAPR